MISRILLGFILFLSISYVFALELATRDSALVDIFVETNVGFSLIGEMPLTVNMEREIELSEEAKDAQKRKEKRRSSRKFPAWRRKSCLTASEANRPRCSSSTGPDGPLS